MMRPATDVTSDPTTRRRHGLFAVGSSSPESGERNGHRLPGRRNEWLAVAALGLCLAAAIGPGDDTEPIPANSLQTRQLQLLERRVPVAQSNDLVFSQNMILPVSDRVHPVGAPSFGTSLKAERIGARNGRSGRVNGMIGGMRASERSATNGVPDMRKTGRAARLAPSAPAFDPDRLAIDREGTDATLAGKFLAMPILGFSDPATSLVLDPAPGSSDPSLRIASSFHGSGDVLRHIWSIPGDGLPAQGATDEPDDKQDGPVRVAGVPALGDIGERNSQDLVRAAFLPLDDLEDADPGRPVARSSSAGASRQERSTGSALVNLAARGWEAVLSGDGVFLTRRNDPGSRIPVFEGMVLGHLGRIDRILVNDAGVVVVSTAYGGDIVGAREQ